MLNRGNPHQSLEKTDLFSYISVNVNIKTYFWPNTMLPRLTTMKGRFDNKLACLVLTACKGRIPVYEQRMCCRQEMWYQPQTHKNMSKHFWIYMVLKNRHSCSFWQNFTQLLYRITVCPMLIIKVCKFMVQHVCSCLTVRHILHFYASPFPKHLKQKKKNNNILQIIKPIKLNKMCAHTFLDNVVLKPAFGHSDRDSARQNVGQEAEPCTAS